MLFFQLHPCHWCTQLAHPFFCVFSHKSLQNSSSLAREFEHFQVFFKSFFKFLGLRVYASNQCLVLFKLIVKERDGLVVPLRSSQALSCVTAPPTPPLGHDCCPPVSCCEKFRDFAVLVFGRKGVDVAVGVFCSRHIHTRTLGDHTRHTTPRTRLHCSSRVSHRSFCRRLLVIWLDVLLALSKRAFRSNQRILA